MHRILGLVVGWAAISWHSSSSVCLADPPTVVRRYPAYVSGFELATHEDLLYRHLLDQMIIGDDPSQWPVLGGVANQVGQWIGSYLNAQRIANVITVGMPVEGQPPLEDVSALVADCAKILGVSKPLCFVRNLPETKAYSTELGGQPVLVLTSGLIKLYHGKPDELRFIVGRELGHIKCDHIRMRTAATGILGALRLIDLAVIPDQYEAALPTLALGRLCSWARESEISADRAGLLCCQDPKVAYQALLRLLHGLDAASAGQAGDYDAIKVIKEFERWQDRPFVDFLTHLQSSESQMPFIPERIAALKLWADTGNWRSILARAAPLNARQLLVIKQIGLTGLAASDAPVNPYLVAHDGRQKMFTTRSASKVTAATWKQIDVAHACHDWPPIFFEVWNDTLGADELLAGFVLYPEADRKAYHLRLIWDWKDRSNQSRAGLAEVQVEFREKAK